MNRWTGFWQRLPRDARDTLFQLFVIGWTILPHALHLPLWCAGLAAAMLTWRGWLALGNKTLPSRWTVAAVLTLAGVLTYLDEGTLFGKEAGVTMLVVLMTLKTLELRARRDALVVFFLGFFLVLTHFFYSQSLPVAISMLVSVWGLLTALVLSNMPVGRPPLKVAAGLSARAALIGAPVMIVLFLLFPRIAPLWGMPQDAGGRTGLSGSLRLGGVAQIANDDSIALRVKFAGRAPPAEAMYFRGPVLGAFDGREWTRLVTSFPLNQRARQDLQLLGQPMPYEMTVEPSRLALLPLLEITPDRADAAPVAEGWTFTQRSDLQWQTDRPVAERLRVTASAWLLNRHGPRAAVIGLRDWVTLPPGHNPRTLQWAANLRARPENAKADASVLANAVLQHIRTGGFSYTLEPGLYERDAIDEFWLDRKLGFCEHFAASFVVIMRAMDVPARIVTGYQGTDASPVDGYWIVRQSNAHAWAEYWLPETGWIRVDPTAAVAPERIQRGRSLQPTQGFVAEAFRNVNPALAAAFREQWEMLNNRWNQWVLNYSRGQQFDLLRHLGVSSPSWQDLSSVLLGLLCTVSLLGVAWAAWDRWRQDPWQRLQQRVQARLRAVGVTVLPHHPPRARAELVRHTLGERGEAAAVALEELDRMRYAEVERRKPAPHWWRHFTRAVSASGSAA